MKLPSTLLLAALVAGLATAPAAARAQAFYRVELLVFTQAGGSSDAWPASELADYSQALDLSRQARARNDGERRARADAELEAALELIDALASLEAGAQPRGDTLPYPEPWRPLDELSAPMARAKAQLDRSGGWRVQTWLAWHQPLESGMRGRAVRVHDQRLIDIDWIELSPTGQPLRNGRPAASAIDLAPTLHYRLDGYVRLRQRQFMHADVRLDWRVPEAIGPDHGYAPLATTGFEVHHLDESRSFRPDQLEYFDSPWLGVLLRVTPWKADDSARHDAASPSDTEAP